MRGWLCAALVGMVLLAHSASASAADVELSACGAIVPGGATAILTGDLDCSATSSVGVDLGPNATLKLSGFSLIGNPSAGAADGVRCAGGCTIVGPGTIRDFSQDGVSSPASVSVREATIRNHQRFGVNCSKASIVGAAIDANGNFGVIAQRVQVDSSSVSDNAGGGLYLHEKPLAKVSDSTIAGNGGEGIHGFTSSAGFVPRGVVKLTNSLVSANGGDGLTDSKAVIGGGSDVSDNDGSGVTANRAIAEGASVTGNGGSGILTDGWESNFRFYRADVRVIEGTVTGNGLDGIVGDKTSATSSTITGNRLDAECGVSTICADIKTWDRPAVESTVCETSYAIVEGTDWDVCSLDPL